MQERMNFMHEFMHSKMHDYRKTWEILISARTSINNLICLKRSFMIWDEIYNTIFDCSVAAYIGKIRHLLI